MDKRDAKGLTEAEFLAAYKQKDYPRPSFTADVAVFAKDGSDGALRLLMVKRGGHPYLGCWALPGGFVSPDEDANTAAARELREETGVAGLPIEQFGVYSAPGRDPRGWTVSAAYAACLDEAVASTAGDDAADAQWCALEVAPGAEGATLLTVQAGEDTLTCLFQERSNAHMPARAHVIESNGFAFDHAEIVADAYLAIFGPSAAEGRI
ncbi:MAG: NUDIX hydrolase [Eggerthellaceae bacterium]|nr:NUDIX hydrolase [Eggerthellaceae bacterium]